MDDKQQTVGIAVIGCGEICGYHCDALRLIPQARLRVFCDIIEQRAAAAAAGAADYTTRYQDAIDRADVDLVLVLTPNMLHKEIAVYAATCGKHVFVQKPFARTVEECHAIMRAAEENHVKLFVSYMHRYFEETLWAKEFIAAGGLGKINLVNVRNSLPGSNYSTWQYDSRLCGPGGAVLDVGVHGIDLIRFLLGDIETVQAAATGRKTSQRTINGQTVCPDNEDWALVQYRLKSGAEVSHMISWVQKWHCNRYTMEIHGDNGSVYLRTGYGPLAVTSPALAPAGDLVYPALPVVPFGYRQHREVIDTVLNDAQPACGGEDGVYAMEIVARILEKAALSGDMANAGQK